MALTQPYGQHNFIGRFANDGAANAFIVAAGWDVGGNPQDEMWYYDTTNAATKIWIDGAWNVMSTNPKANGTRLSLDSGLAVPITDATEPNLYLVAYFNQQIALYTGGYFFDRSLAGTSPVYGSAALNNSVYDVFAYWDTGSASVALDVEEWTNDITRNISLVQVQGVQVKATDFTRRYVGTVRVFGGNFVDTAKQRLVWNFENRVRRGLYHEAPDTSWSYATPTWRPANANPDNNVQFVIGALEDTIEITLATRFSNGAGAGQSSDASISVDVSAPGAIPPFVTPVRAGNAGNDLAASTTLSYGPPNFTAIGYHVAYWVEAANLSGGAVANTFFGRNYGHLIGSVFG